MSDLGLYFPLFVDIREKQILVFGGGVIASRRVSVLMGFGGRIRVIAPKCSREIAALAAEGQLEYEERGYELGEIREPYLVLATTNNPEINGQIYEECKRKGILVNVASDQKKSDFFFPGIATRGSMVIGITAGGKDHRKAKEVTEDIRKLLNSNSMEEA